MVDSANTTPQNPFFQQQYRTTFDQLVLQGVRSGQIPNRTATAREWFRGKAQELSHVTARRILREEEKERFFTGYPMIGRMYLYIYDPKHKNDKKKLPYYDHYPIIFPIEYYEDGWLGLNLHYLPLTLRAKLMDAMYPKAVHGQVQWDQYNTHLNINYEVMQGLKGMAKKYFSPTIKRYLASHVRSRLMLVYPVEWDVAAFLPLAEWSGATQKQVFEDAYDIVAGRKPTHATNIRRRAK